MDFKKTLRNRRKNSVINRLVNSELEQHKTQPILPTIEQSEYEVENYYRTYNDQDDHDLSVEQCMFALEFIKNGFRTREAALASLKSHDEHKYTDTQLKDRGRSMLSAIKVRNFIQDQLNARCQRLQVTTDWIARKYKYWSEIDVTQYIRIVKPKNGRAYLTLSDSIDKLPSLVRSAIRSVSVTASGDIKIDFIDQKASLDSLSKLLGMTQDGKSGGETSGDATIELFFDSQDVNA